MSLPERLNGLSTKDFPPIAFVDLDGVVFEEGTTNFIPGAVAALQKATKLGWELWFFSSGISGERLQLLTQALGYTPRAMTKPLACAYCFIDDRLVLSACSDRYIPAFDGPKESPIWEDRK